MSREVNQKRKKINQKRKKTNDIILWYYSNIKQTQLAWIQAQRK